MMKFLKRTFSFDRLVGMGMLVAFLALFISDPYPVQFFRAKSFDMYQRLQPREIPPRAMQPVVIIDLDETSLAEIGQWPWSRLTVAKLIVGALNKGAAQVAFDMVFAEPDRMNPEGVVKSLYNLDDATREAILKLPSNDDLLAGVLKQGNVVLGQAGFWDERPESSDPIPSKSVAWKGVVPGAPKPHGFLPSFVSMVRNVPVLEKAAKGHGIFSLVQEPDGIVRRVPTLFQYGGQIYPSLSVEMMRVFTQRRTIIADVGHTGIEAVGIAPRKMTNAIKALYKQLMKQSGDTENIERVDELFPDGILKLPTDGFGRTWPYFSKHDKSKYISAKDVLNGTVDPKRLAGKIALVGTSAVGLLDIRATPIDTVIPGVEIHAQVIEAAFSGDFLSRPPWIDGAEILLILLGGLLIIWLVPSVGAKWTLAVFLMLAGGATGGSWLLFTEQRTLFDITFAVVAMFFLYSTLTYMNFSREEADKRQTRDAFSKYLSPDMVEVVAADPDKLKLGGEQRDMTLLFCDVRGFTTISEQFDAQGLTSLINKLLTPLTNEILKRKGTVDKYMGDCIMAFWNAPLDDADHARHACLSALAMQEQMAPLNERLEAEAIEEGRKHIPLKVGTGLNTGECVVGNMGSDQRFDYSVLGDTVNLASRLEGQSKTYGVRIVIGEPTKVMVEDFATIELDLIKVKGKLEAVRIFSLLGDDTEAQKAGFQAFKAKVDDMLAKFRTQDWAGARAANLDARKLGAVYDIDGLFDLYDERIAAFETEPPGADWDGVFVATSK